MSRSGYTDACEGWALIRWRGAVSSALKGARGQAFLKDMLRAIDALPEKKLIASDLKNENGVCAIGAVGEARGIDMSGVAADDPETVAGIFGIAPAMAAEIVFENDQDFSWREETDENRFVRMRAWVSGLITE